MPNLTVFEKEYSKLNEKQKEAVDTIDGPVMVLAGPGSGKTKVLTLRIANILIKTQLNPSNILCLTFTDNATNEMKSRINHLIGQASYDLNIYTFHAFCSSIIKSYSEYFADIAEFDVVSDVEKIKIAVEIIDNMDFEYIKPFKNQYLNIKELLTKISDLKKEGIDEIKLKLLIKKVVEKLGKNSERKLSQTDMAKEHKNIGRLKDLSKFYTLYQEKLKTIKRIDFDDIINNVLKELETNSALLQELQEKYQYILVDEYQDTNSAQNRIIELLSNYWFEMGGLPNIFVVGDDDQSIYRFQGASLENILFFRKRYEKAKLIILDKNYRSNQEIVSLARRFIDHNEFQLSDKDKEVSKQYKSEQSEKDKIKGGDKISLSVLKDQSKESYYIAIKIRELLEKGVKEEDIAVLIREKKDINPLVDAFKSLKIPFLVDYGEDILETEIIIKILNLLQLILNPFDDTKFFIVASYDFLNISELDLYKLSYYAELQDKKFKLKNTIFETVTTKNLFSETKIENPEKIIKFTNNLIKWKKDEGNMKLSNFFVTVLRESGIIDFLLKEFNDGINVENLNSVNTLFEEIKKFELINAEYGLKDLLEDINLLKNFSSGIQQKSLDYDLTGKIRLMTAHGSKGLEFGYVFIANLTDKKWGNKTNKENIKFPINFIKLVLNEETDVSFDITKEEKLVEKKIKLEDERRLLYVALTRAKHRIYLSYPTSNTTVKSDKAKQPSVFLSEIEGATNVDVSLYDEKINEIEKMNLFVIEDTKLQKVNENSFISIVLKNFRLSPTALNSYLACAYKFKLNNIFRVPRNKTLVLGSALHKALELFFKEFKESNDLPTVKKLLEYYDFALKNELITKAEYAEAKKEGEKILSEYYNHHKSLFVKPEFCEYNFGGKSVYFENIPLSGKIDKIEIIKEALNHTEKSKIRIIDYKSGKPKTKDVINKVESGRISDYKRQLLFYKLLSEYDRNFPYDAIEGQLDFIEQNTTKDKYYKHTIEYKNDEEYVNFKKELKEAWKLINEKKFNRTTDFSKCKDCEYRDHCWPKGIPDIEKEEEI